MMQTDDATLDDRHVTIRTPLSNMQQAFVQNTIMLMESDFYAPEHHNDPLSYICGRVRELIGALKQLINSGDFSLISIVYHMPTQINRIDKMGPMITHGDVRLYVLSYCHSILSRIVETHQQSLSMIGWDYSHLEIQIREMNDHNKTLITHSGHQEEVESHEDVNIDLIETWIGAHINVTRLGRNPVDIESRSLRAAHASRDSSVADEALVVDQFLAFMRGELIATAGANRTETTAAVEQAHTSAQYYAMNGLSTFRTIDRSNHINQSLLPTRAIPTQLGSRPLSITRINPASLFEQWYVFIQRIVTNQRMTRLFNSEQFAQTTTGPSDSSAVNLWRLLNRLDGVTQMRFSISAFARLIQQIRIYPKLLIRPNGIGIRSARSIEWYQPFRLLALPQIQINPIDMSVNTILPGEIKDERDPGGDRQAMKITRLSR